ncbi:hypothetical protein CIL05_15730 [Virgibacillus profundi]|uniref:HD-GYP domain-containing protein n=1 Tax=Virgibacillus profundi TaxID=2024555 RepID=A0A2A2IBG9_9BACI|nr:HD-GYP domain-containing protein [Virgibacillus profundi]PAV28728.1 hypothetical protein CIL05_15730 [Virgibacillus profundi]PXY52896.1 HD-GYP domain-containing protein [Virgibacillus profundi]
MRLASTKSVTPGMILAQSIYNENGVVLIQKGLKLTEKMLGRLLNQGITYIYIEDEFTEDIYVEPVLSDKLRVDASKTIKDIFLELRESGLKERAYILEKKGKKLASVVERIMEDIKSSEKSLSMLTEIFITDDYIFHHSLNVTIYSLAIGVEMNLSNKKLTEIGIGAMLHDIGKIFIDPEILQKPDKLSVEEFEIIKEHTTMGFDFLRKSADMPAVVSHCAYQHHERLDGSGYPRGIKGDEIHTYAKLIGIADVFDAVTSNRVYRDAMLPHEGLEIIYAGAINLFEKNMVEAFKRSIVVYPVGLSLQLSDGREGVVVRQNKHICDRPVIRIMSEDGKHMRTPYELDLASVINVTVTAVITD